MAYSLSATKLQTYHRCPQSYYFRYEYGLKGGGAFGSAALGKALHQALAHLYGNWHYQEPLPPIAWLEECWSTQCDRLSPQQVEEGWQILQRYYAQFIVAPGAIARPVAVEGRIQAQIQAHGIEFNLGGRYDRLDALDEGLELIDYKSAKEPVLPDPETVDVQLGLYYLALEQRYDQGLRRMSLIYLRTGQKVSFEAGLVHKQRVQQVVGELALQMRQDDCWLPKAGKHCDRCTYKRYCPVVTPEPEPLPAGKRLPHQIQLTLSF